MAYVKQAFAARIATDPGGAAAEVLAAYEHFCCSKQAVAASLGCAPNTFSRWLNELDAFGTRVRQKMQKLEERALAEGWHHGNRGGAPKGNRNQGRKVRMEDRSSIPKRRRKKAA